MIPCSLAAVTDKPNILHILVDDLGYADFGYKNKVYQTPTIDALALGGVRLPNYYTFTVCAPSRASIMNDLSATRWAGCALRDPRIDPIG